MAAGLKKVFAWLAAAFAGALCFLVLSAALLLVISPRIDLDSMRPRVEAAAGEALGGLVEIRGALSLKISLTPELEADRIQIQRAPSDSPGEPSRIDRAAVRIELMPLLRKRIVIDAAEVVGVRLFLDQIGIVGPAPEPPRQSHAAWKLVGINKVSLSDAVVHIGEEPDEVSRELRIDELSAQLPAGKPIDLNASGGVQNLPFLLELSAGSVAELSSPAGGWPLDAILGLGNTRLQVKGSVNEPLAFRGLDARFDLIGEGSDDLALLTKTALPDIENYAIGGTLRGSPDGLSVTGLDGHFGRTSFTGDLEVEAPADAARLTGSLVLHTLDLRPWMDARPAGEAADSGRESPADAPGLPSVDLELAVTEVIGLPVEIRGIVGTLTTSGNTLNAPLTAVVADTPVRGRIRFAGAGGVYEATTELEGDAVEVGRLLDSYSDWQGIAGGTGPFRLLARSSGPDMDGLIDNAELEVRFRDVAVSYGNVPDGTPVDVELDTMALVMEPRRGAQWTGDGRLLGQPLSARVAVDDLAALVEGAGARVDLLASGAGAALTARYRVGDQPSPDGGSLDLELSGDHVGRLHRWLGVSPEADLPYRLAGTLTGSPDDWKLDPLQLRLGSSALTGSVGRSRSPQGPLWQASVAFELLDALELGRVFASSGETRKTGDGPGRDIPILPAALNLEDIDLDVRGGRVVLENTDVTDVRFSTRVRDGHVSDAPFSAEIADTAFTGNLALDFRGSVPAVGLDVEAAQVDIGRLLRELELASIIDAQCERMVATLAARGSSVAEILNDMEIDIDVESGYWTFKGQDDEGEIRIDVAKGSASASTLTRRTQVMLDASVADIPLAFTLDTRRLTTESGSELLDSRITSTLAGAELEMTGTSPRLGGLRGLDMNLSLRGERLDDLNKLVNVSLPPLGPYAVRGRLEIDESGYSLSGMEVRVGSTSATGGLELSTAEAKPRLTWNLGVKTLQLDDFRAGGWRPFKAAGQESAGDSSGAAASGPEPNGTQPLLDRRSLQSIDAQLEIRVDQVLSGAERLGSGALSIRLQDGKLDMPLDLDVPGGDFALHLTLDPSGDRYLTRLRMNAEDFDYGIFARRIKPETDMAGRFSLHMDLTALGAGITLFNDTSNGYLDFAVWPDKLRAGVFDFWTANLFFAVLPKILKTGESRLNCVAGRFTANDGIMKPDLFFIDTTQTQVRGKGKIDFRARRIDLRLAPRAKRPKFFSLATPIVVTGPFGDFGVRLQPHELAGTAFRMAYTLVLVPVEYITRGVRPRVDTGKCDQAIRSRDIEPAKQEPVSRTPKTPVIHR